ncbi:MAG: double zinc ribbon domain-containing protein [Erythrobacter sp.]|jgi:ComF family protein|nr:double zinc ribbon domain-containing protein [Erythrobacter sp.]
MRLTQDLKGALSPVVDLLYPPRCPLCGAAIAQQGGLCTECWSAIEVPGEPSCRACQRPLRPGATCTVREDGLGAICRKPPPRHSGILAATLYNNTSRDIVLRLKRGRRLALAELMAQMMAQRLPDAQAGALPPLLVPVPLHRMRLWERGFNQAALLARGLARLGKGRLCVDALERIRRTPQLGGLGQEERRRVLEGAIRVASARRAMIAHSHVLLVDDVLTSGATSDACVAALLDAGAASVRIACFARTAAG